MDLVKVYEHTIAYSKKFNNPMSTKIDIDNINFVEKEFNYIGRVIVENKDSFEMAEDFVSEGLKPLVLNMASDRCPGGGVVKGARAQEEELFRRSNYRNVMSRSMYPLKENEVIYSPVVTVFKDTNYDVIKPFNVSCIAVAALRHPDKKDEKFIKNYDYQLTKTKIESIFKIAIEKGNDSLVLGALGCGVFNNPIVDVVSIFKDCVGKYRKYFKKIGFAVLVVKSSDKYNLIEFKKIV